MNAFPAQNEPAATGHPHEVGSWDLAASLGGGQTVASKEVFSQPRPGSARQELPSTLPDRFGSD
jgi:hypothetical protein